VEQEVKLDRTEMSMNR